VRRKQTTSSGSCSQSVHVDLVIGYRGLNIVQDNNSKVSFTFDAGTSHNQQPFLAVTGHWVDSQFDLKAQTLAFRFLKGRHDASNLGRVLASVFHEHGILGKLGTGVSDNIELNGAIMRRVSAYVKNIKGETYDPVKRRGRYVSSLLLNHKYIITFRCTEHLLNLAACHIIDAVSPATVGAIKKKLQQLDANPPNAPKTGITIDDDDDDGEDSDVEEEYELLPELDGEAGEEQGSDDFGDNPDLLRDAMGKALVLIEKVITGASNSIIRI
jgi:hypothetical protein